MIYRAFDEGDEVITLKVGKYQQREPRLRAVDRMIQTGTFEKSDSIIARGPL